MKKLSLRDIVVYLLIGLILLFVISTLQRWDSRDRLVYSDVRQLIEQQKVKELWVKGDSVYLRLRETLEDGSDTVSYRISSFPVFYDDLNDLIVREWQLGRIERYDYPEPVGPAWWQSLLPYLAIAVLFGVMWYLLFLRQGGAGGGGEGGAHDAAARPPVAAGAGVHGLLLGSGGVDGAHEGLLDAKSIVDDLGHGG